MLTIIVLLTQSEERFEFNYEEISIKVYGSPKGVSAQVSLWGVAAWGFNNLKSNFRIALNEIIQKTLMYKVRGRKELLRAYMNVR